MSQESNFFEGFSKLNRDARFERLLAFGALQPEDIAYLKQGGVQDIELAEKLVENVIGYFQLPLGVATNFHIDGEDYVIPMAVEETSIIAALSKTAKWLRKYGRIYTRQLGHCILGQIQLAKVFDTARFEALFEAHKSGWIADANRDVAASMVQRGGGVVDMRLRFLARADEGSMVVIHLTMDCCDAMGANIMNQVLEYLKAPIEAITGEQVTMCILSNLNDERLTEAVVELNDIDPDLARRIEEASLFAEADPYRAATHNKGVMNGIDGVLLATGNDWRAVEAGVHAFAARDGQYRAITQWRYDGSCLRGRFLGPVVVGTVGGVTSLHPSARLSLAMMRIHSASHLSRIIAAVGLVQNLGALRALCTDGIIQGHMKLHIDNLVISAGASAEESPMLKKELEQWLGVHKRISLQHAKQFLFKMREAVGA